MFPWVITIIFLFLPLLDALYKICFGNGHETARSWKTFCGSRIARNLETIWNSLRLARLYHDENLIPTSDFTAEENQESKYEMFSLEHLKYCFGRQFVDWHSPGDPIVWFTTSACLRNEIGSACPCTCLLYTSDAADE